MSEFYILDPDHQPVEVDIVTHAYWLKANGERYHLEDTILNFRISTIFIGIDMGYQPEGPPILFETMIFGGKKEQQDRYATWEEAKLGHKEACAWARQNTWLVWFGSWLMGQFL